MVGNVRMKGSTPDIITDIFDKSIELIIFT
jgi:hypothetical protein